MIVPAHHYGDAHCDVVGHDGHVVHRRAVGPEDHEVAAHVLIGEFDRPMHEVIPAGRAVGDTKADGEWLASCDALPDLVVGEHGHGAIEAVRLAACVGLFAEALQFLGRREVAVCMPGREQAMRVALMALEVRSLVDDLLVPIEAEPREALEDCPGAFLGAAGPVGVLDAQEELAAVLSRVEPVEERRAGAADVQESGGGGRSGGVPWLE